MSKTQNFIKLEAPTNAGYFLNIVGTDIRTVEDMNEACPFDTMESAVALIDYVLPKPLVGSWKVVQRGIA